NCSTRRPPLSARRSFLDNLHGVRRANAAESCPACAGNTTFLWSFPLGSWDTSSCQSNRCVAVLAHLPRLLRLIRAAICQGREGRACRAVTERMNPPDFIEATHAVECVEIRRVAPENLDGREMAAAQGC